MAENRQPNPDEARLAAMRDRLRRNFNTTRTVDEVNAELRRLLRMAPDATAQDILRGVAAEAMARVRPASSERADKERILNAVQNVYNDYRTWRSANRTQPTYLAEERNYFNTTVKPRLIREAHWTDPTGVEPFFRAVFDAESFRVTNYAQLVQYKKLVERARQAEDAAGGTTVSTSKELLVPLAQRADQLDKQYRDTFDNAFKARLKDKAPALDKFIDLNEALQNIRTLDERRRGRAISLISEEATYQDYRRTYEDLLSGAALRFNRDEQQRVEDFADKVMREYEAIIGRALDYPLSDKTRDMLFHWAETTYTYPPVNLLSEIAEQVDLMWERQNNDFSDDDRRALRTYQDRIRTTRDEFRARHQGEADFQKKAQFLDVIANRIDELLRLDADKVAAAAARRAAAPAAPAAPVGPAAPAAGGAPRPPRAEIDGPGSDDLAAWTRYFKENRADQTVAELREAFIYQLQAEFENLGPTERFKPKPGYHKYQALIAELNERNTPDAKSLARYFDKRIGFFDGFNPFANSRALIGTTDELGKTADAEGFNRKHIDYFLGLSEGREEDYRHADLIQKGLDKIEDYLFEIPDLDLKEQLENNTHKRPNGRFVKGWHSFLSGAWAQVSAPMRDTLIERLESEMDADFNRKGIGAKEKKLVAWQIIEVASTLNIRGSLFAILYAVGVSPPGGINFVMDMVKESFPIALEMNNASRTVREIPTIVEGGEIPDEFMDQMEYLLKEGMAFDPAKRDAALDRFYKLKESIRVSRLLRDVNGIPHRVDVELFDIKGNPIHKKDPHHGGHHDLEHMGAHRHGGRSIDKLLILPQLYKDLYTMMRGSTAKRMSRDGLELKTYVDGRHALRDFEHHAMKPFEAQKTEKDLKKYLRNDFGEILTRVSQIKASMMPVNIEEVGETYRRREAYILRFFSGQGYDPLAEPMIALNPDDKSLVSQMREELEKSNWMENTFGKAIFHHPVWRRRPLMTMRNWLLAHLPQYSKDMRTYQVLSGYFTQLNDFKRGLHFIANLRLSAATRSDQTWRDSFDPKTLMPLELKNEKKGSRGDGENEKH